MKILCLITSMFFVTAVYCTPPFSEDFNHFTQDTFDEKTRILLLDGDDGTVACRIYGNLLSATIPRLSPSWVIESATRSLLRMRNLTAVRGLPGGSMVGPADYFGNLEQPHKYLYVLKTEFPPVFYKAKGKNVVEQETGYIEFDNDLITTVKAHWISGDERDVIAEKESEYQISKKHLKQSLFLHPGFLEIDRSQIELKYFDARGVDLSSFKAKIVDNKLPFQITKKKLRHKDDYRLVSYLYEPLYADWQIQYGSGLFLERHDFSQTMTPLTPQSEGFVILARLGEKQEELEMIGVQIPYGYTLIIEEGCIHGDTTLNGFFMMGMTSDHTTMRTADTVFLKYPITKENVKISMWGNNQEAIDLPDCKEILPIVIYVNPTEENRENFKRQIEGENIILNPFCSRFWHK